jgi:hypothetical protein
MDRPLVPATPTDGTTGCAPAYATLAAALQAPAPTLAGGTQAAVVARFGPALAAELLPVLAARKRVAELCAAPRRELAEVVDKRALFVVLGCLDHALRARCFGSAARARRALAAGVGGYGSVDDGGAALAEQACEATPLYECLLRMLLEGNTHNRPAGGGLSREVYAFAKAEVARCLPLLHAVEAPARPAAGPPEGPAGAPEGPADGPAVGSSSAGYPLEPGPAALAELSGFAEASAEMGVAPRFGHVYTARLRRSGDSLLAIPPNLDLKMRFLRRTDPARAEALALCACLVNVGLDARALLPPSHAEGMRALVDERCPAWVGPALAGLFAAGAGARAPEGPVAAGAAPGGPSGAPAGAAHALVPRGLPEWAPPRELRPTLFLPQPAALFQIAEGARAEAQASDARSTDAGLEGRARALPRTLQGPPRRLF